LILSVPDEGYYVPDEGYYVPDEGYYVPDEGYSKNALNLISVFLFVISNKLFLCKTREKNNLVQS
jgi:hypothetical protein